MRIKLVKNGGGFYKVSDTGRVWSCRQLGSNQHKQMEKGKWREVKPYKMKDGYYCVNMTLSHVSNKQVLVHRLVLETFVGPAPAGKECRHKDGNPANNNLDNLKWSTHRRNMKDRIRHKTNRETLTEKDVQDIRTYCYKNGRGSQRRMACLFGVSEGHISGIINKTKRIHI